VYGVYQPGFSDHPLNHGWRNRVVVAQTDVRAKRLVPACDVREPPEKLMLAFARRQRQRMFEPDGTRQRLVDQRGKRADADDAQHRVALRGRRTDMTRKK